MTAPPSPTWVARFARSCHQTSIKRHWVLPVYIYPREDGDDNELNRHIKYRNYKYDSSAGNFNSMTPDHCRLFCWKDCAVYTIDSTNDITMQEPYGPLMVQIYEEWFAHRARDQDLRNESYFAKLMRFHRPDATHTPVSAVREIARFHRALWAELVRLEGGILERETVWPFNLVPEEKRGSEPQFRLRPTFEQVFIVVDDGWETDGVLLVFTDPSVVKDFFGGRSTLFGCGDVVQKHVDLDGSELEGICVFQCPLKQAMKIVVSQDPERAG